MFFVYSMYRIIYFLSIDASYFVCIKFSTRTYFWVVIMLFIYWCIYVDTVTHQKLKENWFSRIRTDSVYRLPTFMYKSISFALLNEISMYAGCVGWIECPKIYPATSRAYHNFDEINFYIRISNFLVIKRFLGDKKWFCSPNLVNTRMQMNEDISILCQSSKRFRDVYTLRI